MSDANPSTPPENFNPVEDNAKADVEAASGKPSQAEGEDVDATDVE